MSIEMSYEWNDFFFIMKLMVINVPVIRIDSMLMDYYGPELYSKMTSEFDPDGVAALSNSLLLGGYYSTTYAMDKYKWFISWSENWMWTENFDHDF